MRPKLFLNGLAFSRVIITLRLSPSIKISKKQPSRAKFNPRRQADASASITERSGWRTHVPAATITPSPSLTTTPAPLLPSIEVAASKFILNLPDGGASTACDLSYQAVTMKGLGDGGPQLMRVPRLWRLRHGEFLQVTRMNLQTPICSCPTICYEDIQKTRVFSLSQFCSANKISTVPKKQFLFL
ncbi:hypothetical protein PIB30_024429 [Stylosanthes scabra]|uniref:Uncharacterized protein n=1 Tax=Stylosanthes scabra TaxID=79078 RepID=A0ABU6V8P9_9FABA|nr:hypothetical protein [Stylosanthes scabra]